MYEVSRHPKEVIWGVCS